MILVEPGRPGWASVTFRHDAPGRAVAVVGEFNQWRTSAPPDSGDDESSMTIEIPIGRTYRFRYVLDGEHWENDERADSYVPNEFGSEDSVLDLRHDGPHAARMGLADSRIARQQLGEPETARDTTL